jgi:hypothetical protein
VKAGQDKTWLAQDFPDSFQVIHFHGSPIGRLGLFLDKWHERIRWSNRIGNTLLKIFDLLMSLPLLAWVPGTQESNLLHLNHRAIHVRFPDAYLTVRWKVKGIFKFVLQNYDFDYILITTSSSYIRPRKLLEVLQDSSRTQFLGGAKAYAGATFVAGNNRILSRDLVEYLVQHPASYMPHIIEDVSMSKSLTRTGVQISFQPHLDISSLSALDLMTDDELAINYHFRLKSGPLSQRNDVAIMNALHQRFIQIDQRN